MTLNRFEDEMTARRMAIRRQMARTRRRVDHRVIRYVDRVGWAHRAWMACRRAHSAAVLVGALVIVVAAFRHGGRGVRWLDDRWREADWGQLLRDLVEAIKGQMPDATSSASAQEPADD